MPKEIATIFKDENRTIVEHYDGVSVLFADVVNFTLMSANMTPSEVVELVNEVFSEFDSLVEKYKLEKIKTIRDCYMVASGVPQPRMDHAHVLLHLALDICNLLKFKTFCGRKSEFLIGINSGPVVAGVIEREKSIYELWGDAFNTASRMESNGVSRVIQITRETYNKFIMILFLSHAAKLRLKGKRKFGILKVFNLPIKPQ